MDRGIEGYEPFQNIAQLSWKSYDDLVKEGDQGMNSAIPHWNECKSGDTECDNAQVEFNSADTSYKNSLASWTSSSSMGQENVIPIPTQIPSIKGEADAAWDKCVSGDATQCNVASRKYNDIRDIYKSNLDDYLVSKGIDRLPHCDRSETDPTIKNDCYGSKLKILDHLESQARSNMMDGLKNKVKDWKDAKPPARVLTAEEAVNVIRSIMSAQQQL